MGLSLSEEAVPAEASLPIDGVGLMCGSGECVELITVFGVVVVESSSGLRMSSGLSCIQRVGIINK